MEYYSVARGELPPELARLEKDDRAEVIRAAGLGIMDTEIAMRYYVDRMAHADIGEIVGRQRSTIGKRLQKIEPTIRQTSLYHKLPQ